MELLCKCGHEQNMHLHGSGYCYEYKDYPNYQAKYLHTTEDLCMCFNFVADNLSSIEQEAKKRNLV